jgi:hypothetical protein
MGFEELEAASIISALATELSIRALYRNGLDATMIC